MTVILKINQKKAQSIFKLDIKTKLVKALLKDLRKQLKNYGFATGGRCYDNNLVIPEMRLQILRVKKTLENYNQYSHCPDKFKHKQIQISDYAMRYGVKE
tara:strand:+ start:433 stop:732 length:300 start_codon:yes stop_codon:yes gene_type:complete